VTLQRLSVVILSADKITKNKLAIEFIKTCISNEKLPNFTRINLHSNDIQKKYIKTIRSEITNEVLNSKIKSKKRFEQELTKLQNKLFDLNSEHWIELQELVEEKKQKQKRISFTRKN